MTSFISIALVLASVLISIVIPSTDAYVASGTRCMRQSKCMEFKIMSCNQGNRAVCMWWDTTNDGCDKFWSQPFPDMCTYSHAEHDIKKFSWRYGLSRMVCQTIDATGPDPAAYFSVRGYVECDGYEVKQLRSDDLVYHLGTAKCQPASQEMCATSSYPSSFYDDYSTYWASVHEWSGSSGNYYTSDPNDPDARLPPQIPNACQWKVNFPNCNDASPTVNPSAMPTAKPSMIFEGIASAMPTKTPSNTPTTIPSATATQIPTQIPTNSVSLAPTQTPTLILTSTRTATPTGTPIATPTNNPTSTSTTTSTQLAECTIMWADIQDASTTFSSVYQQTSAATLISSIYDTRFSVRAEKPTAIMLVDFKDSNGDPYNVGPISGTVSVGTNMRTYMSATLSNSAFFISRLGGIVSSHAIQPPFLDPLGNDGVKAYQAPDWASPNTVSVAGIYPVIVFDGGNSQYCTGTATPLESCSGPWYSYTYVEVCAKNVFATKAPTLVTAPTPLATPAPTATTPLIDLIFTNPNTSPQIREAFENARDLWNDIIINTNKPVDLPAGTTNAAALGCTTNTKFPAGTTSLSGLTIFANIGEIDGVGKILGHAGPCAFSYNVGTLKTFGDVMPRIGAMQFDSADLEDMLEKGTLERAAMHEIGHILGIGTLWGRFRVGSAHDSSNDPRYIGANGVEGYHQIGGLAGDIPVANTGGDASKDSHWRESTFNDELMTGFASGDMPVSIMTIKTLQDLGYVVDESKAEKYSILPSFQNDLKTKGSALFQNDVLDFHDVMTFSPEV